VVTSISWGHRVRRVSETGCFIISVV